jgi:RimJ/RimL family protein N-acetyltransferase
MGAVPIPVTLAPLDLSHAEAMLRWTSQPEVAENLGLRSEPSLERTRAYIQRAKTDPSYSAWAIMLADVHVGNVILDQIDRRAEKARLHIYVGGASARGQGVGKRAVSLAVEVAFSDLGLQKVWLTVHEKNAAAIAAYRSVGFALEGTHRKEFLLDGVLVDELYMGILRSDPKS